MAANCFHQLIAHIARANLDEKVLQNLLAGHIVPLVLRGLRSHTAEACRFAFVECLSQLITAFPEAPQIGALRVINSDVNDEDLDFFQNVIHIQTHRRQRAFFKLTERLKSGEVGIYSDFWVFTFHLFQIDIKYNVLLKFILPLIEPYLLETSPKLSAISDQSLQLFSTILSVTPWTKSVTLYI
jgi:U3 small nucleolar RNA-associated protein 20